MTGKLNTLVERALTSHRAIEKAALRNQNSLPILPAGATRGRKRLRQQTALLQRPGKGRSTLASSEFGDVRALEKLMEGYL
ncbi:MAG: hypothetical protein ACREFC_03820, partial [Stellaceae bacterium]